MTPIPIEGGAGLFLYENSLTYFSRQQFTLPAQELDVVQIWLVSSLLVMFCHCREIVGKFCSVLFNTLYLAPTELGVNFQKSMIHF